MTFARHTTVHWKGTILEGKGAATAGSGAFTQPVAFPRRIGEPEGVTSPEELLAAAHGACYAMVIAANLGRSNASVSESEVVCTVTGEKTDAGLKILSSNLKLSVRGLQGMDAAAFDAMARTAEGKCPVSNALRGNVAISVDVSVK